MNLYTFHAAVSRERVFLATGFTGVYSAAALSFSRRIYSLFARLLLIFLRTAKIILSSNATKRSSCIMPQAINNVNKTSKTIITESVVDIIFILSIYTNICFVSVIVLYNINFRLSTQMFEKCRFAVPLMGQQQLTCVFTCEYTTIYCGCQPVLQKKSVRYIIKIFSILFGFFLNITCKKLYAEKNHLLRKLRGDIPVSLLKTL